MVDWPAQEPTAFHLPALWWLWGRSAVLSQHCTLAMGTMGRAFRGLDTANPS